MSGRRSASRPSVRVERDTALAAQGPTFDDDERERQCQLEKKLMVLADLFPLLRVIRQRGDEASGGVSDEVP